MRDATDEQLREAMRKAYNTCTRPSTTGALAQIPNLAVMNGGMLNQMLDTDTYDDTLAYIVTRESITPME